MVDTYNARDLNRFVNCFAPDAVTLDGLGNQTIKGHESMRKVYGRLFDQSPKLHAEIGARIVVGKYVVTEEHVTGMNLKARARRGTCRSGAAPTGDQGRRVLFHTLSLGGC